jgi:hypothetical protein
MEGGLPAWRALSLPLESAEVSEESILAATLAARSATAPLAKYTAKLDSSKASGNSRPCSVFSQPTAGMQ